MKLIQLKQRSPEWMKWRRSKIMASDAPILMGVSPYKTIEALLNEKLRCYEQPQTHWMQRGIELEPAALELFEKETGLTMFPCVGLHDNEWMAASFDGMTIDEDAIVEIKCPGKKDHAIALKGEIPAKYYPQLQHQICVSELDMVYYYSFDGESGVTIQVKRDDIYIENMVAKLFEFRQTLLSKHDKREADYVCATIVS